MATRRGKILLVREPGKDVELPQTGKVSEAGRWEYEDYWPESLLREELETAWLRGFRMGISGPPHALGEQEQLAADYAERVVGGSTRPARPDPVSTPSKDENSR